MKIQCDVCEKGDAVVFCTADEAALCNLCDHRVHHANKLASKHRRFSLLRPDAGEAPVCDVCKVFCQDLIFVYFRGYGVCSVFGFFSSYVGLLNLVL